MRKTIFVTWPRSGHHAMARVLAEYWGGERWVYLEPYPAKRHVMEGRETVMKEHDFDLDYELPAGVACVVQVRNAVRAIESWWQLVCWEFETGSPGRVGPSPRGERGKWEAFYREKLERHRGWMERWVVRPVPERLIVCYEDLVADPKGVVGRVIGHMASGPEEGAGVENMANFMRLDRALALHPIVRPVPRASVHLGKIS